MKYSKQPLTTAEHIHLLKSRNLKIDDEEKAARYLRSIGYFRLSGYMYHLQSYDGHHKFQDGITFETIISLYKFDKKLRALILEYLERIEVLIRAKLTDKYSLQYGFFWYQDQTLFDDINVFNIINLEIQEACKDPKERFLKSFQNKYTSEYLPPSNMALEILTLGKLCRLYKGLSNKALKMEIAQEFGLQSNILSSWLIYLNNVRNICAHHSRLWNRRMTADKPIIPKRKKYKFSGAMDEDFNSSMYGVIAMIDKLLRAFNPSHAFIQKIESLLQEYAIDASLMGFPKSWKQNAVWMVK